MASFALPGGAGLPERCNKAVGGEARWRDNDPGKIAGVRNGRWQFVAATLAGTCLIVAACLGGGTPPPATGATAPPAFTATNPATTVQPTVESTAEQESSMPFTLTSIAFTDGGAMPRKSSCDGENVSPALEWNGAPDGTGALALIVDDPDAGGFVHWVVFDMTGTQSGGLTEAVSASPDAPPQGRNGFGKIGWGGPCPPSGRHRYQFSLLALDGPLGLNGTPGADDIRQAAAGHTLAQAQLTGTYQRGG
jgi:Raf kinase inhibitor-like YbhB/YbcL family protein